MTADPVGVLVTGAYGVGKSTMIAELADALERRGIHFAALDLDWLSWAWPGDDGDDLRAEQRLMIEQLALIVANLRRRGNDRFLLAYAVPTASLWDEIRSTMSMPMRLVELTASLDEIRGRASSDTTTGRQDDLARAETWLEADVGDRAGRPVPDLVVANDGPIQVVAADILDWLGW